MPSLVFSSPPRRTGRSPGALLVLAALLMAVAGCWLHPATAAAAASFDTVPVLDLGRYEGVWYELAHGPDARASRACAADVVADYRAEPGQRLAMAQRCRRSDGSAVAVSGVARPVGAGARYEVSWLPAALRWLPAGRQDYWVVALDPDYRVAVVSDRRGQLQRVLAREPRVEPRAWIALMTHLRSRGFEVAHLEPTLQVHAGPRPGLQRAVWAAAAPTAVGA